MLSTVYYYNTNIIPQVGDSILLGSSGTLIVETVIDSTELLKEWRLENHSAGVMAVSSSLGRIFIELTDEDIQFISRANASS